jgi:hypothetical protein
MNKSKLFLLSIVLLSLFQGSHAVAQIKPTEYNLLAPIPQLSVNVDGSNCVKDGKPCATTATYIPGLFRLMIAIATGLAVLMLIFAGIKYMSTDAFSGKEEAKGIIENALWGLLLAMSAWLIVFTVNPNLVKFDLSIPVTEIKTTTTPGTSPDGLQENTTKAVAGLKEACTNCNIRITSTTGDSHDPNSSHYKGLAVDIGADDNLTKFLTGQTGNPQACSTYIKTLNGVSSRFLWEPTGSTCGGAIASTGDHWHMSVTQ